MPNSVRCSLFWHLTGNIRQWKFSPIIQKLFLTLKRRGREVNLTTCLWFFEKCIFCRERETLVFCDFYWNLFIEFSQLVQRIWRNSLLILTNFHQFSSVSWIFWHCLVTKTLMMSTYNRWYQNFFIFNIHYWY